ncbi:hypothetical protein BCR32DRAFT_293612 [Anaeromyces robustus]|uniref:FYVE-type domain-containing protein n=1 Tax=Anaeromyces robustus TaxID=1754192 RepID=A0A1Y1X5D9_9FUNG|nr:hypothetical protein BCR32DRAFT_293612 [Anaeromyces robustus]|eukprot:ORX80865.1 hypothetical protein BCR32DRAFT_293612 [Anaeromyces robustus]
MTRINNSNREYKEIYDKENNVILKIKRPIWISDDTVTICQGCKQFFSPFRRKHHCRNSGNIFCQNCSSNTVALPFLGYERYVRVCKKCLKLVTLLNVCLDRKFNIVEKLNSEYDLITILLKGDEHTIQHFINYGGINILNYFCTLNNPAYCHIFIGMILTHLTKFELSEQNNKELLDIFLKLTKMYMENMNKIEIETSHLLFLLQNLVVFLGNALMKAENSKIAEGKEVQLIKVLLYFSYLKEVHEKIKNESNITDKERHLLIVNTIEKIVSKSLSEFCKRKEHQYAIFHNPEIFDLFYKGLTTVNDESRKYLAKSLAYLSLRNDQYKVLILKGSGKTSVKEHVNTLVKCIILDPEKYPDILNSFCNCCYTEYLKELAENKDDQGSSYLSHSYSPKRSSYYKYGPLNPKNNNNNVKHSRHRSMSTSNSYSPIIKKQLNLTPSTSIVSNLTKGLNSSHYRTTPTSPLSKSSISNNFDTDIPTPPASSTSTSKQPSLNGTPSSSPSRTTTTTPTSSSPTLTNKFNQLSLNEQNNSIDINKNHILTESMIKKLKFEPETLFTTNILSNYMNENQNHTSSYRLAHDLDSYNTMISHIVCTLANLICQQDCEELIMKNDQIVFVLCLLIEYHVKLITNSLQNQQVSVGKLSTSLDITRHASRALGNIALNQNNIEMLFSLCTTKQPHIISSLYSLLSLNDETIQRQTLRIVSNIYSKKSINDLTTHSDTINTNLDTIQALIPQQTQQDPDSSFSSISNFLTVNTNIPLSSSPKSINNNNNNHNNNSNSNNSNSNSNSNSNKLRNSLSPTTNILTNDLSPTLSDKEGHLSSPIKSSSSDNESKRASLLLEKNHNHNNNNNNNNNYSALPPLFNESNSNVNDNHRNNNNNNHENFDVHDKNYKRNSLQTHLSLNSLTPLNNNIMMNIDPDSYAFLYHIKYILRFIPIVNYCKDYGCTAEIKRKATSVLNKLKIIVKNYNTNIKKLNQL